MSIPARRRHPHPIHRTPPAGHCELTGKRRWASRADARSQLRELKGRGKRGTGLGTYRCSGEGGCGYWHVGHRP